MKKTTASPKFGRRSRFAMGLSLLAIALIAVVFQNCAPEAGVVSMTSTGVAFVPTEGGGEGGGGGGPIMEPLPDTKAVGVTASETIVYSMLNQTGLTTLSAEAMADVQAQLNRVPESGAVDGVSSPMWMAVTNIAGILCEQLVIQERALGTASTNRRFFLNVDFGLGPSKVTAAQRADVVRRMARSFWGRNETAAELYMVNQALDEGYRPGNASAVDNGLQTEGAMMLVCTAMLSALDAHQR